MSGKITVLNHRQKYQLYKWIEEHRTDCEKLSAATLAIQARADLGFDVSPSSANLTRNTVHPDLAQPRWPRRDGRMARLAALQKDVDDLKRDMREVQDALRIVRRGE